MRTTTRHAIFQPSVLAVAIAIGCVAPVQAVTFNFGEVEAQFDSSLSVGASWSVRDADRDFISTASGGQASSRTSDDGRLNFEKGKTFSKIFKGIHDLEVKYGDTGVFIRGKYWYDFETKDEGREFYDIQDSNRKTAAQSSGAEILDAFLYHNYNLGSLPGSVRVGKQVVSWGESTFIGNSINAINPVDVAAFRRPGAEIKEGLIPVNMLYVSQSLTDTLSMEAFYQLEWDQTVVDNCGTFFSSSDVLADGCDDRLTVLGPDLAPGVSRNAFVDNAYIPRAGDRDARDDGQYGIALRWFAESLNDTEFGAYAMNYHSRGPVFSTIRTTTPNFATFIPGAPNARYFIEYPEDIRLYGLSFQTNLSGTALSGEVSYRPNMPLQINSTDLSFGALGLPFSPVFTTGHAQNVAGADLHGYDRRAVTQAQLSAVQFIDRVLGASRLTLVGEVGFNHVNGISDDVGELRFGRDPIYGPGEYRAAGICAAFNAANPDECQGDGFYTSNSWGYRARASLDYSNVFAGINLSPSVAWSHDVDGYGPNFSEGNKAISLALNADYQNTYTASLSYTDFFGGDYNTTTDRDFVALSFGVNF
ncbi:DUF1302 domain-containing protein [Pseudomonas sp. HMWF032]|uniref:DUF1302 domain-containing protein n=1 Tax=unclassified Pseudomonas TaxID=196821 RepID=UPI000D39A73D|nr:MULTISPECIES: DUF1302 domain-containing protein [unclassified Pseudomonas]PTS85611.1 DUF1302 domain-containing protein [Pseudomonas sp. HMWF032]PTT86355.1 DUF1302 domain-containing protein [Pseudomonas sp. HMWF010]WAC43196.1 DUF1302 domain-containing protein [Pseudomonas sp. SL4(2022)]